MITITLDANFDRLNHPGLDRAECTADGRHFSAESRTGAIHALCRKIRDAGIPDQPWEVPGRIKGGSIYWMADRYVDDGNRGTFTRRLTPIQVARPKL